jgi:hypothetical protein
MGDCRPSRSTSDGAAHAAPLRAVVRTGERSRAVVLGWEHTGSRLVAVCGGRESGGRGGLAVSVRGGGECLFDLKKEVWSLALGLVGSCCCLLRMLVLCQRGSEGGLDHAVLVLHHGFTVVVDGS